MSNVKVPLVGEEAGWRIVIAPGGNALPRLLDGAPRA